MTGDSTCNKDLCDNEACNWDDGDCFCDEAHLCYHDQVGDGVCDPDCEVSELCTNDAEDCWCAPGCDPAFINDDTCNVECNVPECGYDGYEDDEGWHSDCICDDNCQ